MIQLGLPSIRKCFKFYIGLKLGLHTNVGEWSKKKKKNAKFS